MADNYENENEFKNKYIPMMGDREKLKALYEECVAYLLENKEELRAKFDAGDPIAERIGKAFAYLEQSDDGNFIVVLAALVDIWKQREDFKKL